MKSSSHVTCGVTKRHKAFEMACAALALALVLDLLASCR